jgi:hypothetical protein
MRKFYYTFDANEIHRFKFCPLCGGSFIGVYDGDYGGMIQCFDCPEDVEYDIPFKITYKDVKDETEKTRL